MTTPLWTLLPQPFSRMRDCSSVIATWCKMLPPGPPYSSGTVGQSSPRLPAFTQNSRSTNRCSDHLAICGAASRSKNCRATSRSARSSSVIHSET